MTTTRQIEANRANARKSTGPRTERGKARASHNALRHGLSIPVLADAGWSKQVEDFALRIAGPNPSATLLPARTFGRGGTGRPQPHPTGPPRIAVAGVE